MVDTAGNQELHLDKVEIVEPQEAKPDLTKTVIQVKNPRVKKEKNWKIDLKIEDSTYRNIDSYKKNAEWIKSTLF